MSPAARLLFDLCFVMSLGLAAFVYRKAPSVRLNRYFALAAVALFAWLFTLYLYDGGGDQGLASLTTLGRLNFAAVLFVSLLGYLFIAELTDRAPSLAVLRLMAAETLVLSIITLFTPLVDAAEIVSAGNMPTTQFGPIYPAYIVHVAGFLGAGIILAISAMRRAPRRLRRRLATIVLGMLVSAALGLFVDIALPFARHEFKYENVGALAAVIYFCSMAYAITAEHLFDVRLAIRRTFVLTALVALGVEVYELLLSWMIRFLPVSNAADRRFLATVLVLTINALTQDSLRALLSKVFDGLARRLAAREQVAPSRQTLPRTTAEQAEL